MSLGSVTRCNTIVPQDEPGCWEHVVRAMFCIENSIQAGLPCGQCRMRGQPCGRPPISVDGGSACNSHGEWCLTLQRRQLLGLASQYGTAARSLGPPSTDHTLSHPCPTCFHIAAIARRPHARPPFFLPITANIETMLKQCIAIGEIRASQVVYITVRPASRFTSQKPKLSHAMASTLEEKILQTQK